MSIPGTDVVVGSSGKADFDDIYRESDPREYFRVLCGLDYVIPELAKIPFRSLIGARAASQAEPVRVLDVGCSYGINSALIQYPFDIQRLTQRYSCPHMYGVSSDRLKMLDRSYFSSWPKRCDAEFYGMDTSKPATAYAKSVGLLKDVVNSNLESGTPNECEREILRNADLIISTGCVGYISHRTFAQIMRCQTGRGGPPPVVAAFVLRMYSYDGIAAELARHGLITEKLEGVTFVQRRFHSQQEFDTTVKRLNAMGISPAGKESEGLLHAELFVSRTEDAVERTPLHELVSITSGLERRYERRLRRVRGKEVKLLH
jgi:SAM-dependent methyltransferase